MSHVAHRVQSLASPQPQQPQQQQQLSAEKYRAMVSRQNLVAIERQGSEAVLTLDGRGMIRDCNRAGEQLFKYRRSELVWRAVSLLLPELAELELMQGGQPNPRLRYLCRIGRQFQVMTQAGECFRSVLCLNLIDSRGHGRLSLIVRAAEVAASAGSQRAQGFLP